MTEREDLLALAKPCPWCESPEVWVWDKAVPGKFAIACSNPSCAAVGPFGYSFAQAIARWNVAPRRPLKSGSVPVRTQRILDELAGEAEARADLKYDSRSGSWSRPDDDD